MQSQDFIHYLTQESTKHSALTLTIYTDGSCIGNPGPGGWAAILIHDQNELQISGAEAHTTNNRMEIQAAIEALKIVPQHIHVHIYTDSNYLKDGITSWIKKWKLNGWITTDRKPVKNVDLWQMLDQLVLNHKVEWFWVKAHNNHPLNERADALAKSAIITLKMSSARSA